MIHAGLPITNALSRPNSNTSKFPFGTLGGFAKDLRSGKTVGITTFHSVHTRELPWKTFEAEEIEDQSLLNVVMVSADHFQTTPIGKISRTFFDTKIEAALIEFDPDFLPGGTPTDVQTCHFSRPEKDEKVTKIGARTQTTENYYISILEEKEGFKYSGRTKNHQFSRLMSIKNPPNDRFVERGDSGSLIKFKDKIAGMVLGINEERSLAFGMHAFLLKHKLNITFLNHTTS